MNVRKDPAHLPLSSSVSLCRVVPHHKASAETLLPAVTEEVSPPMKTVIDDELTLPSSNLSSHPPQQSGFLQRQSGQRQTAKKVISCSLSSLQGLYVSMTQRCAGRVDPSL